MSATERPAPEEIVLYDKDPETKIATITFNRPEYLNAPTSAARLRYADLLRGATVDDDVKVVVIRGVGDDLGSGGRSARLPRGHGGGPARRATSRRPNRHVSAQGIVSAWRHDGTVVCERRGRQPRAPGVEEDQHRRGQGLLLWVALLPVRRRRPGDLERGRVVRSPLVPLLRMGSPDVDMGIDDGGCGLFRRWSSPDVRSRPKRCSTATS
jgi:hypothetical protein